jgi:hypothetical protein
MESSGGGIMESSGGALPTGGGGSDSGGAASGGAQAGGSSAAGGSSSGECAFEGRITYDLNGPENWPGDVPGLLQGAMDEATFYYNCYADFEKHLTVNYNPDVPTAEANVDGWMSFGANRGYMQVATAMHEISHTLGVGFAPWQELISDGIWVGPAVENFMMNLPAEERDSGEYSGRDYIRADDQHFWPYGLNQASEYLNEWSLINNVRIVRAINEDKQAL